MPIVLHSKTFFRIILGKEREEKEMSVCVGLDIGTTNSCCFVREIKGPGVKSSPELVPTAEGGHLTPSMVCYTGKSVLVGVSARQQQQTYPETTFTEFKRVIGKTYEETKTYSKHWGFSLLKPLKGEGDEPIYGAIIEGDVARIRAVQLYTVLLHAMFKRVHEHTRNTPIRNVTITVPAHFDSLQRKQVREAARKASGIDASVISILNEPTAAMLAYAATHEFKAGESIMVVDIGGGTTDVSLVEAMGRKSCKVVESRGLSDLGGMNFDARLCEMAAAHHKEITGHPLHAHPERKVLVKSNCEQAKRTLGMCDEVSIHVAEGKPSLLVTREEFERAIAPDVAYLCDTIKSMKASPDHIILCGGSSRVPAIRKAIRDMFEDITIHTDINADECVAMGACLYASNIPIQPCGKADLLPDKSNSLSGKTSNSSPGKSLPGKSLPGKDESTIVCIQDVLNSSLGIRTGRQTMSFLIPKNTPLPAKHTCTLHPYFPGQTFADLCVFQGEHDNTKQNTYLGYVRLEPLDPIIPSIITLTCSVDLDGIVRLDAHDNAGHSVLGETQI